MVSLININIKIPPEEARNLKLIYANMIKFETKHPVKLSRELKPLVDRIDSSDRIIIKPNLIMA